MRGIDGPERKGTSRQGAFDDDHRDTAAPARAPAAAPWNADFERVLGRTQPYDQALFSGSVTFIGPRTLLAAHPAADSAWDAVKNAPMPRLSGISTPSCTPLFAVLDNARTFADRGIPVAQALQHSLLTSVEDLERFLDEYIAYSAGRPEMKGLHDDALRTAPAIFAKRLDTEAAEQRQAAEEARMHDRLALMQTRAPLPVQQRVVIDKAKAVPIVGELVTAAEVATGRRGLLPADEVRRLIDGTGAKNLHGQAWDVADLRVLIMREPDPVKKAQLTERLTGLMDRYRMENRR